MKQVFQLTMVSQNDPGTGCGDELYGIVLGTKGGTLNKQTSFPYQEGVHLPIPSNDPPKSPTWFLELDGNIEDVSITVVVFGPEGKYNPTIITIDGANMPSWVAQNEKEKTNQIYVESADGIFGYAQENIAGDTTNWIYTITAGVANPMIHPPV
ncbi:hypothetical protein [uncultured Lacinutrix sp.]|uniref:hypothetical protein n=1 Tax=uncultured Lacinutrix sp. TaxID=574032 RepID=UPI002603C52C|nr:hypothetical protein [uncultured Lacinutrix sp.]